MDEKTEMQAAEAPKKSRRGFASMDPEKQRAIASKGGKTAHAKGKAHQWTRKEASEAGKKGGLANGNRHQFTSLEARAAGSLGGQAKAAKKAKKAKRK